MVTPVLHGLCVSFIEKATCERQGAVKSLEFLVIQKAPSLSVSVYLCLYVNDVTMPFLS
jgi:hypothetical protein